MTTTNKPTDAAGEAFEAAVRKVQDMIHAQQNWITDDIRSAADALVAERVKEAKLGFLKEYRPGKDTDVEHLRRLMDAELTAIESKGAYIMSTDKEERPSPFIDPRDLPKMRLADGTEVKLKAGPWRKSRRGQRFNGKHRD